MSITVSPLSQTVSEGGVATFTAIASGIKTGKFEYEWFKFEGQNSTIVGRNKNLIMTNVRVEDAGLYFSCVKNEWSNTNCSVTVNLTISSKWIAHDYMHSYGLILLQVHHLCSQFILKISSSITMRMQCLNVVPIEIHL